MSACAKSEDTDERLRGGVFAAETDDISANCATGRRSRSRC